MKGFRNGILAVIVLLGVSASGLYAEEPEVSGYASVGIFSDYVWRGIQVHDDGAIQPSVGITYGGFGANLWADYDIDANEHVETDLTLSYGFSPMDKLSLEVGYIYYAIDGADNDSQEFYLSAGYDILLRPSLTFYYDFDAGDGGFLVASRGRSFGLPKEISLSLGGSASVNFDNAVMGANSSGNNVTDFYNGEVSASVSIPVYKAISIEPMIAYTFSLSDDAKDAIKGLSRVSGDGVSDKFYGGATISLSF